MPADNIHALFGLLLLGSVVARFLSETARSAPLQEADVRNLTRRLSRMVYLLLYLVAGLEQLIGRGVELRRDGAFIVACALITLIVIRVLAIGMWLRTAKGASWLNRLLPRS
jgi:hypothetical protein